MYHQHFLLVFSWLWFKSEYRDRRAADAVTLLTLLWSSALVRSGSVHSSGSLWVELSCGVWVLVGGWG